MLLFCSVTSELSLALTITLHIYLFLTGFSHILFDLQISGKLGKVSPETSVKIAWSLNQVAAYSSGLVEFHRHPQAHYALN